MKRLLRLSIPLLSSFALTACLPSGRGGGGGGGGGGEDAGVNNVTDVGNPNNTTSTNNDNNTIAGKTCPDGSVIPIDQACVCPTSIDDCSDGGAQCATVSFTPGSPCGTCTITQINQCGPFDGCCPAGCAPGNDDDCAGCGDGERDPGETCDGDCPRNINDCPPPSSACALAEYSGSASSCNARCSEVQISQCIDFDGCCPNGCDFDDDNDCNPPVGVARHGTPCLGEESACEAIDQNTVCVSQAEISLVDPFAGQLVNPGGVCTPLNCADTGATCRDGTSCVVIMGILPLGEPISACLKTCVDASNCPNGMTCVGLNPLDTTTPTYCI